MTRVVRRGALAVQAGRKARLLGYRTSSYGETVERRGQLGFAFISTHATAYAAHEEEVTRAGSAVVACLRCFLLAEACGDASRTRSRGK